MIEAALFAAACIIIQQPLPSHKHALQTNRALFADFTIHRIAFISCALAHGILNNGKNSS